MKKESAIETYCTKIIKEIQDTIDNTPNDPVSSWAHFGPTPLHTFFGSLNDVLKVLGSDCEELKNKWKTHFDNKLISKSELGMILEEVKKIQSEHADKKTLDVLLDLEDILTQCELLAKDEKNVHTLMARFRGISKMILNSSGLENHFNYWGSEWRQFADLKQADKYKESLVVANALIEKCLNDVNILIGKITE